MRDSTFAWLVLAASVLAEVGGTIALRYADGFTRFSLPSLLGFAIQPLSGLWPLPCGIWKSDLPMRYGREAEPL